MVISFLNWIYVIVTCYLAGSFALRRICKKNFNIGSDVICGVCLITAYAGYFSLFGGVGTVANVLLIIVCGIFLLIDYKQIKEDVISVVQRIRISKRSLMVDKCDVLFRLILTICIVFFVLYYTAYGRFAYDTGLYHAQSIHWIEDYGVVKGLAYLQSRLGFNSSYFCLCALYSLHNIEKPLHTLSGFFSAFVMIYALWGFNIKRATVSNFLRVAPFAYFIITAIELVSPTTDFVTILLIIWLCIRWFEIMESDINKVTGYSLLCVMAVFLVSIKLSVGVLALLVIAPAYYLIKEKRWKEIAFYVISGLVLILPYFIRNVIITGWLIYPFPAIDLFDFDWEISKTGVQYEADEIVVWARYTRDVSLINQSIREWFPVWWEEQGQANRYLSTSAFISAGMLFVRCLVTFVYVFVNRFTKVFKDAVNIYSFSKDKGFLYFGTVFFVNFMFFFLSAPSNRFGYSYILVIILLVMGDLAMNLVPAINVILNRFIKYNRYHRIINVAIALSICMVPGKGLLKGLYLNASDDFHYLINNISSEYIINQKDYPTAKSDHKEWEGIDIYYPVEEGEQIWYYDFPAVLYEGNLDGIERRGESIKDGFRMRQ